MNRKRQLWAVGCGVVAVPLGIGVTPFALVCDEDSDRVALHNRSITSKGYARTSINGSAVYLHRFILNPPPDIQADHINGDRLDCRRSNLRLATHSENTRNRRKSPSKTSKYKGVSLHDSGGWRAKILFSGQETILGIFADELDAARAYDLNAIKLFGDFARLNFPPQRVLQSGVRG